jgi:hypothetical protein
MIRRMDTYSANLLVINFVRKELYFYSKWLTVIKAKNNIIH